MTKLAPDARPVPVCRLGEVERSVLDLFVDGVRVLGLPKSIGEIYGLLFMARGPLALDDLVAKLGISKGSASQGLRMLREIGAVRECELTGSRRTYYEPEISLKRLVGGFIREQVVPHLESGRNKLATLARTSDGIGNPDERAFVDDRIERLGHWFSRGRQILPLLQRLLGE